MALEPVDKSAAKERMRDGGGDQCSPGRVGKLCTPGRDGKKSRDKIGEFAGVSGETVRKIAAVVKAAEKHPKKYAGIVDEMDKTGKVDKAYRRVQQPTHDALGHPYEPGERTAKQPKTPPAPTEDQLLTMIEAALIGDKAFQAKVEALPSWRLSATTRPIGDDDDGVDEILAAAANKFGDRPPPPPIANDGTPIPPPENAPSIVPDDDFPELSPELDRRRRQMAERAAWNRRG